MNHHQKRKDVTKVPKIKKRRKHSKHSDKEKRNSDSTTASQSNQVDAQGENADKSENIWKDSLPTVDVKSREEEFDEYLGDLFL